VQCASWEYMESCREVSGVLQKSGWGAAEEWLRCIKRPRGCGRGAAEVRKKSGWGAAEDQLRCERRVGGGAAEEWLRCVRRVAGVRQWSG